MRKLGVMYRWSIAQRDCAQSKVRAREGLDIHVYAYRYLHIYMYMYRQVCRHICEGIPICVHMYTGVCLSVYARAYT